VERFGLASLLRRRPRELSGGQRQRVCLAQTLAREPRLLLLDEPFSALDAPVRSELQRELRRLQHEAGLSTILVTHDAAEAALLADEVLVLLDGRLAQSGPPQVVYRRPATPEVARLVGIDNILPGRVGPEGFLEAGGLQLGAFVDGAVPGEEVLWCIHPEHVEVGDRGGFRARVVDSASLGAVEDLELDLGGGLSLHARVGDRRERLAGQRCPVGLPADAIWVWPDQPAHKGAQRGVVRSAGG
jgi:molybdate transport system permease protein